MWGNSKDNMFSLDTAKPGWVLPASCLLAFPRVFKFVCFLPIPQSQAGFLYMLTTFLQRLLLATIRMEVYVGEACRMLGCPWTSWGDLQVRSSQGSLADFLLVCRAVRRIHIPSTPTPSERPGCYSLSHFLPASHRANISILNGVEKHIFLAALWTTAVARHLLQALTFCHGRNLRLRRSLGTKVCHLGGEMTQAKTHFFLPLAEH